MGRLPLPACHHKQAGRGQQGGFGDVTCAQRHHPVTVDVLKYYWQGLGSPVKVLTADLKVWKVFKVGRPSHGLADCGVVGVFHIQAAQRRLPWVGHREESLREPLESMPMVDQGKVVPDHIPQGEGIKELVPQEDVLCTQL